MAQGLQRERTNIKPATSPVLSQPTAAGGHALSALPLCLPQRKLTKMKHDRGLVANACSLGRMGLEVGSERETVGKKGRRRERRRRQRG